MQREKIMGMEVNKSLHPEVAGAEIGLAAGHTMVHNPVIEQTHFGPQNFLSAQVFFSCLKSLLSFLVLLKENYEDNSNPQLFQCD